MKLIINADDFGYTKGVTDGILEGVKKGIIRSTTVMCNMPYIEYGKECSIDYPELGLGVHLNLTVGKSLTANKTLTDDQGNFLNKAKIYSNELDMDEVYNEWKAQIEKFIEIFKRKPTHLDSHHSVHDFNTKQFDVANRLAREYGVCMRRYSAYQYVDGFFANTATVADLKKLLIEHQNENIEIMVHPGFCDLELYQNSSYNVHRVKELEVLCNPEILDFIKERNIELTHY